MLGGAATGVDLAHPVKVATTNTSASAVANFSDSRVVRGNFAADQFALLRPRIGFGNRPQYKLVHTLSNIAAETPDHVVRRSVKRALEVGLCAAAHRLEQRAHFLQSPLAVRREAAEQDQSRFD